MAEVLPEDIKVSSTIAEGDPTERVLEYSNKLKAVLIIIPSHAKSSRQLRLGSCAAKVVEQAKCPVTVIRN